MTSDIFDTKFKTSLPDLDLKLLTQIRVGSYATNTQLILVDPVEEDVEEFVHGLILQTSDNAI
jgi:hypothetical protein